MFPLLVQLKQDIVDYNNVQMLQYHPQIFLLIMDVIDFELQHLVQHQELDVFHYLIALHIKSKLVVSKELTDNVSGIQ